MSHTVWIFFHFPRSIPFLFPPPVMIVIHLEQREHTAPTWYFFKSLSQYKFETTSFCFSGNYKEVVHFL